MLARAVARARGGCPGPAGLRSVNVAAVSGRHL